MPGNDGFRAVVFPRRLGSRRSLKRLIPILPDRLEPATAKDCGDFSWGTFIADLELTGGELVFALLVFGRHDATAQRAMQMFVAFPSVTAGFGMTTGAHHGYAD